jgi:uncharacterized membrane protein
MDTCSGIWYLVAWVVVVALAFASYPIGSFGQPLPIWLWQVVLVSTGVMLAAKPLLTWKSDILGQKLLRLEGGAPNRPTTAAVAPPR